MRRFSVLELVAASLVGWAALADSTVLETSTGAHIETSAPASMSCEEMALMLRRIDETGYRAGAGVPPSEIDAPLFSYETGLFAEYHGRCVQSRDGEAARQSGFSSLA